MRGVFLLTRRFQCTTAARGLPTLRVGSLNLRCLNANPEKVAAAIRVDAPPLDVLGVQEVGPHFTWEDKLARLADLLGMRVAVTAEGGWCQGIHCALLVSNAATEMTAHKPCTMGVDGWPNRCAVAVSLGPNMPHVINTHLDHHEESNRTAQLEQLRLHAQATWGCLEAAPMLLLGDLNALRRADYSDAQWTELETRRFNNGIESVTDLTDALERPTQSGGWGWSDCRAVALRDGGTVTGELATSVYGARVDYVWASPALLRSWAVSEVAHVDVAQMHGSGAFTDHALVTCTLRWKPKL